MKSALASVLLLLGAIPVGHAQSVGVASYHRFPHFSGLVAAHRTLPFGTYVRVTNLNNGRTATVLIVDRGPYISGRIIDVSTPTADALGFRQAGVARVEIEVGDR
jgi:rare lipoprotein A